MRIRGTRALLQVPHFFVNKGSEFADISMVLHALDAVNLTEYFDLYALHGCLDTVGGMCKKGLYVRLACSPLVHYSQQRVHELFWFEHTKVFNCLADAHEFYRDRELLVNGKNNAAL